MFESVVEATHKITGLSADDLEQHGPIFEVNIGFHQKQSKIWRSEGYDVPEPMTGLALVDTGSDQSCIDHTVVDQLVEVPQISEAKIMTIDGAEIIRPIYPVRLEFGQLEFNVEAICIPIAEILCSTKVIALIGRDILKDCSFVYHGPTGNLTLSRFS